MFTAKQCELGEDTGKWFTGAIQPGGLTKRLGYCGRDWDEAPSRTSCAPSTNPQAAFNCSFSDVLHSLVRKRPTTSQVPAARQTRLGCRDSVAERCGWRRYEGHFRGLISPADNGHA